MRTITKGPITIHITDDPSIRSAKLYDCGIQIGPFSLWYNHFARAAYMSRRGGGQHVWPLPFVDRTPHL